MGCCPFHDDRSPSFYIYLDRNYGKCFGCGAFVWNPVELWARVKDCDPVEALNDLKQSFGLKFLTSSATTQLRAWERRQKMLQEVVRISHNAMLDAINDPAKSHPAVKHAVEWLVDVRKISLTALPTFNMVGVLPPAAVIYNVLDEAAERETKRLEASGSTEKVRSLSEEASVLLKDTGPWVGSVMFRYDCAPSAVGRIKLRRPHTRDFVFLGDDQDELGFFGLGWNAYKHLLGPQQQFVPGVHVVEGEFDALSLMGKQVETTGGPQMVVIASGGSGSSALIDDLSGAAGIEEVYLFGDSPDKNGDRLIQDWLLNTKKLRARVFVGWKEFAGAGDPDEAVLQYGIGPVSSAILDLKNKDRFQTPQEWIFDQAAPQMSSLDQADVRQKIEVASGWGKYLRDHHECDAFVQACSRAFDIPAASLKRQIVANEEDEPAFIQRLADLLSKEFQVIGHKPGDRDRKLYLWNRQRKSMVTVALADDGSIERELGAALGPAYQYFADRVGIPSFMDLKAKDGGPYLQKFDAYCRWYYKQALTILAHEAPEFDDSNRKGQGIHVIRGEEPVVYVVNGRKVYRGSYTTGTDRWEELDAPIHNGIMFDVLSAPQPWMRSVGGLEDIERARNIDLLNVYQRIRQLLDVAWRFKHQQTATQFLAAHLLAASICSAFRRQTMVGIHGESQSGKSRLLSGLISGTSHKDLQILSAAVGVSTYSAAGVRQSMANTARPLALDEFEDEGVGDKKSRVVADILDMFRNLTGEDNVSIYGSRSGTAIKQSLNMFVFVAAITKARKVQDANRMVMIDLQKGRNVDDPVEVVRREFPPDFIANLRGDLEVALLPHVGKMIRTYDEVAAHYAITANRPANAESRYVEALQPAMTIMRMLGIDDKKFIREFCAAHEDNIIDTKTHSESSQLLDWVLQSPQIPMHNDDGGELQYLSVLQILAKTNYRRRLNSLGCGVYFDENEEVMVVNWTTATQTVLSRHNKYSKETSTYSLRETANRHSYALKPAELEKSGVLSRLRRFGVAAMTAHTLSAFRISPVLRALNADEETVATTEPINEPEENHDTTRRSQHADYF